PEVNAVLHAHPPHATAFGLCGLQLSPVSLPEIVVSLGDRIPTIMGAFPKDPETLRSLKDAAGQVDALVLQGNGALTLGADLNQALLRMELVEHYAKILSIARGIGSVPALEPEKVKQLLAARQKAGLGPQAR